MMMTRTRVFFLTVLYLGGYGWLRAAGEIEHVRPAGAGRGERHYVGAGWSLPLWRQQTYRFLYSPIMVAEEEARRFGGERRPADRVAGFDPEMPWNDPGAVAQPAYQPYAAPENHAVPAYYDEPLYETPALPAASTPAATPEGIPDGWTAQPDGQGGVYYYPPVSGMIPTAANIRRRPAAVPNAAPPPPPPPPPAAKTATMAGAIPEGGR